jgi:hypothetical protein
MNFETKNNLIIRNISALLIRHNYRHEFCIECLVYDISFSLNTVL